MTKELKENDIVVWSDGSPNLKIGIVAKVDGEAEVIVRHAHSDDSNSDPEASVELVCVGRIVDGRPVWRLDEMSEALEGYAKLFGELEREILQLRKNETALMRDVKLDAVELNSRLKVANARIETLVKALRPFGIAAQETANGRADDDKSQATFTHGELRAAVRALWFDRTTVLPDGSGATVASLPLPRDHWIYAEGSNEPPVIMPTGLGPVRVKLAEEIRAAARFAIRASTMNGREMDFDPDAMVQNMILGIIGYWTENGLNK